MSLRSVVIVDYGIGNVFSVSNAVRQAGGEPILTSDRGQIAAAERLLLPGVGAFGKAMQELEKRHLVEPIRSFCATGRPFMGICIGMQLLMDSSSEVSEHAGLGLLAGKVERLPDKVDGAKLLVPHIGWSSISPSERSDRWSNTVFANVRPAETFFYFVHSYEARPETHSDILATADYGGHLVTAAVQRDNITGVQFHPERSGIAGQKLLQRYLAM